MEKNRLLLAVCLKEIEGSLGWGESAGWSNDDLENLGEKIWEKTGTRLSLSTMRRIWGRVKYDNSPNTATLNALAIFAGYADWRSFCAKQEAEHIITMEEPEQQESKKPVIQPTRIKWKNWAIIFIVLAGAVVLLLALRQKQTKQVDYSYPYVFTAKKVTDDLPNSVVFTYDAGGASGTTVRIQQSWDTSRNEVVDAQGTKHTSIYYYPGYFQAKLIVNDSIVKQAPVYIQTKGWKGIANRNDLPVYFKEEEIRRGDKLSISTDLCRKAFHAEQFDNKRVQLANIREFPGIEGDDFKFEAMVQSTATEHESLCRKVSVIIMGSEYPIIIPLAVKGCIADLYAYVGDSSIDGRNHDLSALGCDFSMPQQLICEIKQQVAKIYLNSHLVLEVPQIKPMGKLVGIRFLFEGPGEISGVVLSDTKGVRYDLMK
ncbi:MAG: hypothetical protein QM731_24980 [Chitinophagaceae bacterium]